MSRSPRRTDLERDRRGASVVEYTLCAGLVALATLGGARLLGERTGDKADAHAACIEQLDCGQRTHRDSARPTSAAVSGADDDLSAAAPPAAPIVGAAMAAASDGPPAHPPATQASALSHDPPIGDAHHIREALEYRTIVGQSFLPGGKGAVDARVDIHPDDVMQGQLGDCYWMAAMAAVALRDPEAIRSSIREQGGEYSVTLWERRSGSLRPRRFDVAPSFPVSPRTGALVFAQTSDERGRQRELWPMILEKALAQSKGSYQGIENGSPAVALETLTGKPARVSRHKKQHAWNLTFAELAAAVESGNPVLTASPRNDWGWKGPLFDNDTVVREHTYYVSSVDRDKQTVTLRNPWGWTHGETTLSFADYKTHFSALITTDTRAATQRADWNPFR